MLRLPASIRSFREVPVLGSFLHTLSYRILPSDQKVWAQVEAGPAKGIWLELNPRTGQNYRLGETEKICQAVVAEKLRSRRCVLRPRSEYRIFFPSCGANRRAYRESLQLRTRRSDCGASPPQCCAQRPFKHRCR